MARDTSTSRNLSRLVFGAVLAGSLLLSRMPAQATHAHAPAGGLAFQRGADIWMELDGSLTPLTQDGFGDAFPSWAPDWTVLAFASESRTPSTTRSIWTLDAYTGVLTQVTDDSTSDDRPTWSPDGSKIAFQSAGRGGSSPSIWMIELATSVLTRITDDAGSDDRPAWSPDGTKIASSLATEAGRYRRRSGQWKSHLASTHA